MTSLQGSGKTIHFAFSNTIHEIDRNNYVAEMPLVICSNRKDAERIQEDVGAFISELSKKLLNK